MEKINSIQKVVFCDFDGTITELETFAGMLKEFAPELSAELMPLMYAKQLTLREGVRQLLESIPSQLYPAILEYSDDKHIRPGLPELLDYLNNKNVPFIVVSGGIRGMVERVISRKGNQEISLVKKVTEIYAVDIDTSGEKFKVISQFEGGTELLEKVQVMAQYPAIEQIAIGDSVTDINMALKADRVFARDRLIKYMEAENKPYIPWNNFFDILNYLKDS